MAPRKNQLTQITTGDPASVAAPETPGLGAPPPGIVTSLAKIPGAAVSKAAKNKMLKPVAPTAVGPIPANAPKMQSMFSSPGNDILNMDHGTFERMMAKFTRP
jgi:hypothetical protein